MIESYARLRDAYAIIDGIPEERIDLSSWLANGDSAHDCNTLACAAGWLAMHPAMNKKGLKRAPKGMPRIWTKVGFVYGYHALAEFFGVTSEDAFEIFRPRRHRSNLDPENRENFSDKELWKFRVQTFLNLNAIDGTMK